MTPHTRLLKCFVLIKLCCKTKHLRSLVQAIVRGFEWLEVLGLSKSIYAESGDWTSSLFEGTGVKTEMNYFLVWRMVHFVKECTYLDSKEEQRELSRRCPLLVTTNQHCHEKNHSKLFLSSPYPSSLTTSTFTNAIWAKNISIYQVGYYNII